MVVFQMVCEGVEIVAITTESVNADKGWLIAIAEIKIMQTKAVDTDESARWIKGRLPSPLIR